MSAIVASRETVCAILRRIVLIGAPVEGVRPSLPPDTSTAMDSPVSVQKDEFPVKKEKKPIASSPLLPPWIRVGSIFAWVRTPAPPPIRFVSSGWETISCFWGNGDYQKYRPIWQAHASNLVMGAREKTVCCRYYGLSCTAQGNPRGICVGCG